MRFRMKLWVERDEGGVVFGEGRLELLQAIDQQGSLAAAAREMGMSYRAAWGRLKASEERLGIPLVERSGKGRKGMTLTAPARRIMEIFGELESRTQATLEQAQRSWPDEYTPVDE